VIFAR